MRRARAMIRSIFSCVLSLYAGPQRVETKYLQVTRFVSKNVDAVLKGLYTVITLFDNCKGDPSLIPSNCTEKWACSSEGVKRR